VHVGDADLWTIVLYEMAAGCLILGFLRLRGLPWSELRPVVTWSDTLRGIGVFFGAMGAVWLAFVFAAGLPGAAERLAEVPIEAAFGLLPAVLVVAINPLFEEAINIGYIQARLRPQGAAFAVGAALLVRLLANLDQEAHALVGIVPLGLLFGIYTWRTGRLWPVIVAHALIEGISLFAVSHPELAQGG
jgi:membrane protease YdiL (CAAX protease family)